jgi:hypothetical protein
VQYWKHLIGQIPLSVRTRSRWRKAPAAEQRLLEEKAGQAETSIPLAGQVLGKYDRIRMANGPASVQ